MSSHKIALQLRTPAHFSSINFFEAVALANVDEDFSYDKHLTEIYSVLHEAQGVTNPDINFAEHVTKVATSQHFVPTINGYILSLQQFLYQTVYPHVLNQYPATAQYVKDVAKLNPVEPFFVQKSELEKIQEHINLVFETHVNEWRKIITERKPIEATLRNDKISAKVREEALANLAEVNVRFENLKQNMSTVARIEHVGRYLTHIPRTPKTVSKDLFQTLLTALRWNITMFPELLPVALAHVMDMHATEKSRSTLL